MEERSDEGTVEIPQDINNIAASPSTGTEPKSKDPEQITGSEPIELVSLPGQNTTATEVLEEGAKHAAVNDLFAQTERHLQGWRLYFLTFGLCLSLLLSTLETTIISTALVSISNAMGGFQDRDWVVTSYLLTYTGFLVIYAKFSDIFGAKFMMLLALLVFTVFSVACGAATGMTELIVLRSFQGLGASGIYSMVGVVTANVIPPSKFSKYMAVISSVFAVSSVLGPVLGGAITQHTTWRWVFLLNAPGGAAALGLIIFTLPSDFSAVEEGIWTRLRNRFTISSFKRLDLIGSGLMLAASILLVFALEEAGSRYAWASGVILGTLLVSVVAWAAFVGWEILIDKRRTMTAEPIFPMRLLKRRVVAGMLLNAFFTGFPFTTLVVTLPQRFQAINSSSPSTAGLLLLPLLLISPFASGLAAFLGHKMHIPPFYLILFGSATQLLGVGLMLTLPTTPDSGGSFEIFKPQYVYEILMGLGFGLVLTSLLGFVPLVISKADLSIMLGAVTQVRVLGGTIGLAISSTILNSYVTSALEGSTLTLEQMEAIGQSLSAIGSLSEEQQLFVRGVFARGYERQMRVTVGFSGCVLLAGFLMWEKVPRRFEDPGEAQPQEGESVVVD